MDSFRRDLFIDTAVDRFIFKNNQILLSPRFTSKTGWDLSKMGVRFYYTEKKVLLYQQNHLLK